MNEALTIRELFYREAGRSYHVEPHSQALHQWYLCVHGTIETRLDGKVITLHPGQSLLYRPGVIREPRCRGHAPSYLIAIFANHGLTLDPICDQILTLPLHLREDLNALIAELVHPQGNDSAYLSAALLVRLLIGQCRSITGIKPALNAQATTTLVATAEQFMRNHLHESLDRSAIAMAAHCSVPHLARLMRSATGETLLGRLLSLRLAQARQLLRDSDESIGAIALICGFASFSHFARSFKTSTRMTPSAYRRTGGAGWNEKR